ncbi:hypothetical protein V5799_007649 [Amblyomma americanum]|uniref:Uncharacterized protein n=1 Tax=Amblyomma americanum TaxID=6943 RepID=A0AAQ4FG97_AMBAM
MMKKRTVFLEPDLSSHAGKSTGSPRQFFSVTAPMVPWEAGGVGAHDFQDQRQPAEDLDSIVDGIQNEPNVPATQLLPLKTEHDLIHCENSERQDLQ